MTAGGAAGNAIRPQLVGGENPHCEMLVPAGTIAIDQPAGERACVHCRRGGKWPVHRLRAPVIRRSPPLLHSSRCKAPCSPITPKLTPPWCASRITPTSGRDSNKPGQPWRTDGSWLGSRPPSGRGDTLRRTGAAISLRVVRVVGRDGLLGAAAGENGKTRSGQGSKAVRQSAGTVGIRCYERKGRCRHTRASVCNAPSVNRASARKFRRHLSAFG